MALSDRAAALGPYAQQLLDNQDVQAKARQAANATRAVYQRSRGQDAREAVKDRKLRRRITGMVAAVGELFGVVSEAAPKRKSRWPWLLAVLAVVITAGWLVSNQDLRARVQGLWGGNSPGDETIPVGSETTPNGAA